MLKGHLTFRKLWMVSTFAIVCHALFDEVGGWGRGRHISGKLRNLHLNALYLPGSANISAGDSEFQSQNTHNLRICVMCVLVCVYVCEGFCLLVNLLLNFVKCPKKLLTKQRDLPDRCQISTQCSTISSTFVCQLWQNMQFAHLQNRNR